MKDKHVYLAGINISIFPIKMSKIKSCALGMYQFDFSCQKNISSPVLLALDRQTHGSLESLKEKCNM